ncbi:hypothetical protein CHUAL_013901 [Chamberlinius hualienensis]
MNLLVTWSLVTVFYSVLYAAEVSPSVSLRTTTVYGFLDFTTTIDHTVVVFRPSSHAPSSTSSASLSSSDVDRKPSAGVTSDNDQRQTTIRTDADDTTTKNNKIIPTPTLASKVTSPPPSNRNRVGAASALADKRRRFLAQVRRHRPIPPSNSNGSSRDVAKHADQEMAETIDVIPSKVKRYHDDVTISDDPGRRQLVRKLYRRPNLHSDVSSSKSRLLLLRNRSGAKARLTGPVRGRENPDEIIIVSSSSSSQEPLQLLTSSKPSFDPSSATIAEYLPIDDDDVIQKSKNKEEIESKILLESSQNEFPVSSTSVWDEEETRATAPLPVTKSSSASDPGLTVPIQLSIVTSTFSLTETRLRTSLLPVYDGTSTTFYTLTHSFLVTKTVTTFQTVPPEEFMPYLIPANDSINAINDVFPEWMDDQPDGERKVDLSSDVIDEETAGDVEEAANNPIEAKVEENPLAVASNTADPRSLYGPQQGGGVNPLLQNLPFLNLLGPAAALGLNPYFPYGLGQLGPQIVTTSRPVFTTSVVFTSKLLPIIDGLTTSYHTIRAAASTVTQTNYETFTTQLPNGPGANLQHNGPPAAPMGAGAGASTVVNPHTFVTTETQTATQVFKLMYDGYKTSFRTVSSLTEVTRTITTLTTTTVPLYTHAPLLPFFG